MLKGKKIAIYARVSKALEQNPENQLAPLRAWAKRSEVKVVREFVDTISSRDTRPQKEEVLGLLRTHQADGVVFYALDRWGRNMAELVLELQEFTENEWHMIALKEKIDLSSAAGRMFAHILAAMANFERDRNTERTLLGQARAVAQGKIIGRHPVDCGCGAAGHNGQVKPVRDKKNRFIGWQYPDEKAMRPAGWSKIKEKSNPPCKPPKRSSTKKKDRG